MRIYKIVTKKEAKLLDLFKPNKSEYEEASLKFVENYLEQKNKMPTVGEVVLMMLQSSSLNTKNIDHSFLKTIASSVISKYNNQNIIGI